MHCRLNVGGKLLTNYLKELITHRQWNVMDDTAVVNQVKEELCFCANEYVTELAQCQRDSTAEAKMQAHAAGVYPGLLREFVLPDYHTILKGYVKPVPQAPSMSFPEQGDISMAASLPSSRPEAVASAEAPSNTSNNAKDTKKKKATPKTAAPRKKAGRRGRADDDDDSMSESDDWSAEVRPSLPPVFI